MNDQDPAIHHTMSNRISGNLARLEQQPLNVDGTEALQSLKNDIDHLLTVIGRFQRQTGQQLPEEIKF